MGRRLTGGRALKAGAALLALACAAFLGCSFYVDARYRARMMSVTQVPFAEVGLVFGAGLAQGNTPSPVLAERLEAGLTLYRAGKVRRLLVSGDNTERYHDEPGVMRRFLLDRGVPEADIQVDDAGVSTFDSCVRAKETFGVTRATLVTQRFHLSRALYIANQLGLDAHGVPADRQPGGSAYSLRELVSRPLAFAMVLAR